MRIKINQKYVKQELRRKNLTYLNLEILIGGDNNHWKHVLNNGGYVTDIELKKIVDILQRSPDLIIDPDFQIDANTPLEIDLLIRNLYVKRKGNIQPVYETIIKNFQKMGKLENFIGEANRLLSILFSGDELSIDMVPALSLITYDLQKEHIFSNSPTELDEKTINDIFNTAMYSLNRNSAQQALAIFLYVVVIFDVVFLEESIASVTQFTMERFNDKSNQYCFLTQKIEILRNTLINYMIARNLKMDNDNVEDFTDEILDGVHLMLLACNKAGKHMVGDHFSSEYVDRSELDAIITRLNRIISSLGIQIPEPILGLSGLRFMRHIGFLRTLYLSKKQITNKPTVSEIFAMGFFTGKNS